MYIYNVSKWNQKYMLSVVQSILFDPFIPNFCT